MIPPLSVKLSVGVPVYNQALTIAETINSLLNQEVSPFEIVVSDNHSTDGTSEILIEFADRIRIIRPPSHLPMMANWNFCVSSLKSEWFTLLSGDDLARPRFVAALSAAAGSFNDAVLVRGDWEDINAAGDVIAVKKLLSVARVTRPPRTWEEQLRGPKVSFAAFALRHSVWRAVGGFSEKFHIFGDWALWLKVSRLGAFVHAPEIIAAYRVIPRPQLDVKRVPLRIADEHTLICDILPDFFPACSRRFSRLARMRFFGVLNYIVEQGVPELTAQSWRQLEEIATLAGRSNQLAEWRGCPKIQRGSVLQYIMAFLRRMAHRLSFVIL